MNYLHIFLVFCAYFKLCAGVGCVLFWCRDHCTAKEALSKCGPHSTCTYIEGITSKILKCKCKNDIGEPPNCLECTRNSDCQSDEACIKNKCKDPCKRACGAGASCDVIKHRAKCSCPGNPTADPHRSCIKHTCSVKRATSRCGPHSKCTYFKGVEWRSEWCKCKKGIGKPPHCLECSQNSDCQSHEACIKNKCKDPCKGACGAGASCDVIHHRANCSCPGNPTADPHISCHKPSPEGPEETHQKSPQTLPKKSPKMTTESLQNLPYITTKSFQESSKFTTTESLQKSDVTTKKSFQESSKFTTTESLQKSDVTTRKSFQESTKFTTTESLQKSDVTTKKSIQESSESVITTEQPINQDSDSNGSDLNLYAIIIPSVLCGCILLVIIAVIIKKRPGSPLCIYAAPQSRFQRNITATNAKILNNFYLNLLFRKECDEEIIKREHFYEEVD